MESEDAYCHMPECPHLRYFVIWFRPTVSSEDFDDIDLEEKFSLSEIETETQGA